MIFREANLKHRTLAIAAVLVSVLALTATPGMARGGAGSHAGGSSSSNGSFGGQSAGHMSTQGSANSNGPNSTDRDFGRERSSDRNNASGLSHANNTSLVTRPSHVNTHRWLHGRHHHYGWRG